MKGAATLASTSPPQIEELHAAAYTIPTDALGSDGTIEWSETTLIVVFARAGGSADLGYSYADRSAQHALRRAVRNIGQPGIASAALSAVDFALSDLKARLLDAPLLQLLGEVRPSVPAYGSGGLTSYSDERLTDQSSGGPKPVSPT